MTDKEKNEIRNRLRKNKLAFLEDLGFNFDHEYLYAYKAFRPVYAWDGDREYVKRMTGPYYPSPRIWKIAPGSIIGSRLVKDPFEECERGVHIATLSWIWHNLDCDKDYAIWKVRVSLDAPNDIVVPYIGRGKIRVRKLQLLYQSHFAQENGNLISAFPGLERDYNGY